MKKKLRVQSSSATSSSPADDLQSQPSTSTNPHQNLIQPLMRRSQLETNSLTASLWTSSMVSADSNTPSDMAFYRRASWLEEYALHRLRSIEDRSEARKQEAAAATTKRSSLGNLLTSCLPCTRKGVQQQRHKRSIAFSSQTSLTSMLEKAEEEDQRMAQVTNGQELTRRPEQRLIMITSSL